MDKKVLETYLTVYLETGSTGEANEIVKKVHGQAIPNRTAGNIVKEFNEKRFEILMHREIHGVSFFFRAIPYDIYAWEKDIHPKVWAFVERHNWEIWSVEVLVGSQWYSFDYDSLFADNVSDVEATLRKLRLIDFFNNLSINIQHLPKSWLCLAKPVLQKEYDETDENRRSGLRNFDDENKLLDCID